MKRVLVTGAGGPAATNFIRSLRLAPEPFYIVGTDANAFHLALSHAHANHVLPPVKDPAYIDELNRVIEHEKIEFVHAQPDIEVYHLSEHRERLCARMLLPDHATIETCSDKLALGRRLADEDVPFAQTFTVTDEQSLTAGVEALLATHDRVWLRARRGAGGTREPACDGARAGADVGALLE